jgi:hypothetical protein
LAGDAACALLDLGTAHLSGHFAMAFGYLDEVDEPDTQPGLLLFGGVVSVALLSAVAVIGRLVRRRIG